ncbi:MAG: NAD(P)/FAD-dependent oxidoreductase [Paracoccaceae bacterium]
MIFQTDTVIIGAGQAGLAVSRYLSDQGIDHVVFERGAVGERWRSERWSSLHLLTPNWMSRLPGFSYAGADPNGYMHKNEVANFLSDYKDSFSAPVLTNTQVISVTRDSGTYEIITNNAIWRARTVVIATGACDKANVPGFARKISTGIAQFTPTTYKSPDQIKPGGVLVVGASATGVQLAKELLAAGLDVTVAAGSHIRVPRRYRGQDVMHWLDRSGILAKPRIPGADPDIAVRHPSLQLVGGVDAADIDLNTLRSLGARIVGRAIGAEASNMRFEPSMQGVVAAAEIRQRRLLERIDTYIDVNGIQAPQGERPEPMQINDGPSEIDLADRGITTILWATGYRREYPWLKVPVLSTSGEVQQIGGVTPMAGLFTMGLPFMRRRNSTYIDGVGHDAWVIAQRISRHLGHSITCAA